MHKSSKRIILDNFEKQGFGSKVWLFNKDMMIYHFKSTFRAQKLFEMDFLKLTIYKTPKTQKYVFDDTRT